MMYLVVFYEEYVGHHFDDETMAFNSLTKANAYCHKLNVEWAKTNGCSIKDLGDYYVIEQIEVE